MREIADDLMIEIEYTGWLTDEDVVKKIGEIDRNENFKFSRFTSFNSWVLKVFQFIGFMLGKIPLNFKLELGGS